MSSDKDRKALLAEAGVLGSSADESLGSVADQSLAGDRQLDDKLESGEQK